MEIVDVARKLVGEINPIGETHEDNRRYENLKVLCEVADTILSSISEVASYEHRIEYSIKRSGKYAGEFLKSVHDNTEDE